MKAVHFRRKAVMHYFGFVEAGIHYPNLRENAIIGCKAQLS